MCVTATARDEVDAKKKRSSDPMCTMTNYVDQSIKVRKLKEGFPDEVCTTVFECYLHYCCRYMLPAS